MMVPHHTVEDETCHTAETMPPTWLVWLLLLRATARMEATDNI